jgi:hypothetical protein
MRSYGSRIWQYGSKDNCGNILRSKQEFVPEVGDGTKHTSVKLALWRNCKLQREQ